MFRIPVVVGRAAEGMDLLEFRIPGVSQPVRRDKTVVLEEQLFEEDSLSSGLRVMVVEDHLLAMFRIQLQEVEEDLHLITIIAQRRRETRRQHHLMASVMVVSKWVTACVIVLICPEPVLVVGQGQVRLVTND